MKNGLLPEGYTAGAPTLADIGEIAALMAAAQWADLGTAEATAESLADDLKGVDLATMAVLVRDEDGTAAAYADIIDRAHSVVSVYGHVHPDHRGRGLGRWLVDWGERYAERVMPLADPGAMVVVQHFVPKEHAEARELLAGRGYEPVREVYEMTIDLRDAPAVSDAPGGFDVRAFRPGIDDRPAYEAMEDAFRDLWGRPQGSWERYRAMLDVLAADPGLMLLAWDGDDLVGQCWARRLGDEAWIDALGVGRRWRGRGLGRFLLLSAFAALRERGVRTAMLNVDAENASGAARLYIRAGMRILRGHDVMRRVLRPGSEAARPV